jgi:gluconolactonase
MAYGAPLPQNRAATLIKGGYAFTEGPVWINAQKALYFSEFTGSGTNGRIHKYTPADGMIAVFAPNIGTNGLAVDPQGQIVAASHDMQRITRFDPATATRTQVMGGSMYMNKPFNSVNDLVVRSDGNIYFSDPSYQRGPREGQDVTAFYRLSPMGVVTRIGTANQPNGISLSPNGAILYVASSGGTPLRRYSLDAQGAANPMGTMVNASGSDGMAIDCAGNIYLTTAGLVRVISPAGAAIGDISGIMGGGTTNVAFGGEDHRTLFITGGRALYQIKLQIPGLPN